MTRERLPNRRSNMTSTVKWRRHEQSICAGFSRDGRKKLEVFARAKRPNSDLYMLLDDLVVLVRRLLQHRDRRDNMGCGIGRAGPGAGAALTSVVGVVLDELCQLEHGLASAKWAQ